MTAEYDYEGMEGGGVTVCFWLIRTVGKVHMFQVILNSLTIIRRRAPFSPKKGGGGGGGGGGEGRVFFYIVLQDGNALYWAPQIACSL